MLLLRRRRFLAADASACCRASPCAAVLILYLSLCSFCFALTLSQLYRHTLLFLLLLSLLLLLLLLLSSRRVATICRQTAAPSLGA